VQSGFGWRRSVAFSSTQRQFGKLFISVFFFFKTAGLRRPDSTATIFADWSVPALWQTRRVGLPLKAHWIQKRKKKFLKIKIGIKRA